MYDITRLQRLAVCACLTASIHTFDIGLSLPPAMVLASMVSQLLSAAVERSAFILVHYAQRRPSVVTQRFCITAAAVCLLTSQAAGLLLSSQRLT